MTVVKTSDAVDVRDMYDAMADSYSEMMDSEMDHPIYADTLDRLKTQIENISGAVIDAPCGSGHMLSMYHERYDKERSLLGVDLSPRMVAITKKRLGSAAEVVVGDIRELLMVETGSAAAVISHFAFHHMDADEVDQALAEWSRVLKAGGQLVIGAWEGNGQIDYGDAADVIAIKHDADVLESVIKSHGFTVSRRFEELDEEMQMNAVYFEGVRQ